MRTDLPAAVEVDPNRVEASLGSGGEPDAWRVPAYVFRDLVPPLEMRNWACVTPPPPPLKGADELGWIRAMSVAWKRVVDHHAAVRAKGCPTVSRKHRHFASAVDTVREVAAAGISGEAYQLAAFRAYPQSVALGRPHPFVWSLYPGCRVRFMEEASAMAIGRRLVVTPSLGELIRRRHTLVGRFIAERPDVDGLKAMISECFPPGFSQRELTARAHREASAEAAKVEAKIASGGWPW